MPSALLTGSAGFVGRHLHDALVERGYDVAPFDIKDGAQRDIRWQLANGDLGYYDLIVHCAAIVGGRAKIDGAPLEVAYDFGLDSDMVQFCARTRPGRVVLFSSSAAYPVTWQQADDRATRLYEDMVDFERGVRPDAVYGLCKIALEYQARELAKLGLKVHVFRPFSGYGADQDDDYPFPAILRRVLDHENLSQPFEIWSDPDQTRDWIHIDDIVRQVFATIGLGEWVDAGGKSPLDPYQPLNLCTGEPTTFRGLVQLAFQMCDVIGYPRIERKPGMPSGVHYRVGDPTKINQIRPAQISLVEGIRAALDQIAGEPVGLQYARPPVVKAPIVQPDWPETRTFLAPSCDRSPFCSQGLNHPGACTILAAK